MIFMNKKDFLKVIADQKVYVSKNVFSEDIATFNLFFI